MILYCRERREIPRYSAAFARRPEQTLRAVRICSLDGVPDVLDPGSVLDEEENEPVGIAEEKDAGRIGSPGKIADAETVGSASLSGSMSRKPSGI